MIKKRRQILNIFPIFLLLVTVSCQSVNADKMTESLEVEVPEEEIAEEAVTLELNIDTEEKVLNSVLISGLSDVVEEIEEPLETNNTSAVFVNGVYYYRYCANILDSEGNDIPNLPEDIYDMAYDFEDIFVINDKMYFSTDLGDSLTYFIYDYENATLYEAFTDEVYTEGNIDEALNTPWGLSDFRYSYFIHSVQFENCIIVEKYDRQNKQDPQLFVFDFDTGKKNNIDTHSYLWVDYGVSSEDYFIIHELKANYFDNWGYGDAETANQNYITFIDKATYNTAISIDLNQISEYQPRLFKIENQSMYFYCEEESDVIEYNTATGDVIQLAQFDYQTNYIDYDADENCLYLKLNKNFSYRDSSEDNYESEYVYFMSTNIDVEDADSAEVLYLKYYIDNQSYEVIKSISLSEYQETEHPSKYMKYYRVNDYIFAYTYTTVDGYGHFCYKMKLE